MCANAWTRPWRGPHGTIVVFKTRKKPATVKLRFYSSNFRDRHILAYSPVGNPFSSEGQKVEALLHGTVGAREESSVFVLG